eukprot:298228-Hanusia_phi.AAC.7
MLFTSSVRKQGEGRGAAEELSLRDSHHIYHSIFSCTRQEPVRDDQGRSGSGSGRHTDPCPSPRTEAFL